MIGQLSIFDIMQGNVEIPSANAEGYIPANLLVPIKQECWKYSNSEWTMRGGEPYVINAILAILPGNRLYVKRWMMYPFMYEFETMGEVSKKYHAIRKEIVERMEHDNDVHKTWRVDEALPLEDMWRYKDGEYSCKEYAEKMLYGYGV